MRQEPPGLVHDGGVPAVPGLDPDSPEDTREDRRRGHSGLLYQRGRPGPSGPGPGRRERPLQDRPPERGLIEGSHHRSVVPAVRDKSPDSEACANGHPSHPCDPRFRDRVRVPFSSQRQPRRVVSRRGPRQREVPREKSSTTTKVQLFQTFSDVEILSLRGAGRRYRVADEILEKNLERPKFEHCTSRNGG